jgi:hypothetical protein
VGVGSPWRLRVLGGSWEVESVEQDAILRFGKLGMPYLEHLPCMGMVRKLSNILNGYVKKV